MYVELVDYTDTINIIDISRDDAERIVEAICIWSNKQRINEQLEPGQKLTILKQLIESELERKQRIYRSRDTAAAVSSKISILEPAILALDDRIDIQCFAVDYIDVKLPADRMRELERKIQQLIDTQVE